MIRAVLSSIGLVLAGCNGVPAQSKPAQPKQAFEKTDINSQAPELHVVGVYEGRDRESDFSEGSCATTDCIRPEWPDRFQHVLPVELSRPGRTVTLVVGSYEALNWDIRVDDQTMLERVVVVGHGANEAAVAVNGEIDTDVLRQRETSYSYKTKGPRFRKLADELPSQLGFQALSGFHGSYRAPSGGFVVDGPTGQPELQSNYLDRNLGESDSSKITFEAVLRGQPGEFRLNGDLVAERSPIETPRAPLTSARDRKYVWNRTRINVVDTSIKRVTNSIPVPNGVVRGHFRAMTIDEKRNRLVIAFQAGAAPGHIFAVDLDTHEWERLGTTGRTKPTAIYYDESTDTFLVSFTEFMHKVGVARLFPDGEFVILKSIPASELPGSTDLFDPENDPVPPFYVLAVQGHKVVLAAGSRGLFSNDRHALPLKRIYEMDLETGRSKLTFYE